MKLAYTVLHLAAAMFVAAVPLDDRSTTSITPWQFLSLGNDWWIQMPVGLTPSSTTSATIRMPSLSTFTNSNFFVNSANNGVVFNTTNTGITLSGGHPRTEFRHYAQWAANTSAVHYLNGTLAADYVPRGRLVIVTQLFGASEGCESHIRVVNSGGQGIVYVCSKIGGCATLDSKYTFGTFFSHTHTVANGKLTLTYKNLASGTQASRTVGVSAFADF